MLSTVYIENIAVIEKVNIPFASGFNVLTGETGAGKSIIIDAINMILGQRTSHELIRSGSNSAFVSATFEDINSQTIEVIRSLGFDVEDNSVILQREIYQNGRNVCRVNSRPATVSALREIGATLITINGQHESFELFSADVHLDYIDAMAKNNDLLAEYRSAFNYFKEKRRAFKASQTDDSQRMQQIDILKYQIEELSSADLKAGEQELLIAERDMLQNVEKITSELNKAKVYLNGNVELSGALELLQNTADCVQEASYKLDRISGVANKLMDMYYELEDCNREIENIYDNVEINPQRLEQIEERLDLIYKLSRKYGKDIGDMLQFLDNAQNKLNELENYEINRESLANDYQNAKRNVIRLARLLTQNRKQVALDFAQKVKSELVFLDMPNVEFTVSVTDANATDKGMDKVEFLVSANKGEQPKPISKIASGGELSRIMLAIKNVIADNDTLTTMIFDEVDTGISGSAALKVGLKLKELSSTRQVMCITHQAQIAALANEHFFIQKNVDDNRTFTTVNKLNFEDRKSELARIIGGAEITQTALAHAEELLIQGGVKL